MKKRFLVIGIIFIICILVLIFVCNKVKFTPKEDNKCTNVGNTCTNKDIINGIIVSKKVKENKSYDFYVIEDNNNKMTLLMKDNLIDNVQWSYENENFLGPNNLLDFLYEETKDWINVNPILSYNYEDFGNLYYKEKCVSEINYDEEYICPKYDFQCYGYEGIIIENGNMILTACDGAYYSYGKNDVRARLISKEEIDSLNEKSKTGQIKWLNDTESFWTSSSSTDILYEHYVRAFAKINYNDETKSMVNSIEVLSDNIGLRPVIEVEKK